MGAAPNVETASNAVVMAKTFPISLLSTICDIELLHIEPYKLPIKDIALETYMCQPLVAKTTTDVPAILNNNENMIITTSGEPINFLKKYNPPKVPKMLIIIEAESNKFASLTVQLNFLRSNR